MPAGAVEGLAQRRQPYLRLASRSLVTGVSRTDAVALRRHPGGGCGANRVWRLGLVPDRDSALRLMKASQAGTRAAVSWASGSRSRFRSRPPREVGTTTNGPFMDNENQRARADLGSVLNKRAERIEVVLGEAYTAFVVC